MKKTLKKYIVKTIHSNIKLTKTKIKNNKLDKKNENRRVIGFYTDYIKWLKNILHSSDCGNLKKYLVIEKSNEKTFYKIFYILHDCGLDCGELNKEQVLHFFNETLQNLEKKIDTFCEIQNNTIVN